MNSGTITMECRRRRRPSFEAPSGFPRGREGCGVEEDCETSSSVQTGGKGAHDACVGANDMERLDASTQCRVRNLHNRAIE